MPYIFKDGEKEDVIISFDILNWQDAHHGRWGPLVDINLQIEAKDCSYTKYISIYDYELIDLAETILKFSRKEIKEYYEWDHIEQDIEVLFNPKDDTIRMLIHFTPSTTHLSGFYFELWGLYEYMDFYKYLFEVINEKT